MTDVAELAEVLQRAKATHKAGNFSEAIPLYRRVLAEVPDSVEAEHGLGLARYRSPANPLMARCICGVC